MIIVIFIQVCNRVRILFCGFADIWICAILESERDGILMWIFIFTMPADTERLFVV